MSLNEVIQCFFKSFQIDFEALNLNKVRHYYALPCQMSMIGRVAVFNNDEEYDLEFKPMFEALKISGFDKAKFHHRSYSILNTDQALVSIAWKFYNKDTIEISEFAAIYNLKNIDSEWKIISVILHNYYKYVELLEEF